MVLSALFFSLMSLTVKVAGARLPSMELVLARGVIVTLLAGADLARRRVPLRSRHTGMLLTRGFVGFLALACYYFSVIHLPLAEATLIHFTNPVFTALIAAAFLGERLRSAELALALAGLAGVVLVVRPAGLGGGALPAIPVASSLTAAVLAAVAYVLVRHLRDHDPMLVVFSFAGVTSLAALPLSLPGFVTPRGGEWAVLLAVGVSTFLGQLFLTLGLQRERAGRAMTIGYVQVVFATIWGILVFGQRPGTATLLGAAVIIGSAALLARRRTAATAA